MDFLAQPHAALEERVEERVAPTLPLEALTLGLIGLPPRLENQRQLDLLVKLRQSDTVSLVTMCFHLHQAMLGSATNSQMEPSTLRWAPPSIRIPGHREQSLIHQALMIRLVLSVTHQAQSLNRHVLRMHVRWPSVAAAVTRPKAASVQTNTQLGLGKQP